MKTREEIDKAREVVRLKFKEARDRGDIEQAAMFSGMSSALCWVAFDDNSMNGLGFTLARLLAGEPVVDRVRRDHLS